MVIWADDDQRYEMRSYYDVPDGAWRYELTGAPGTATFTVCVTDTVSADGSVTADEVQVLVGTGSASWPLLCRFVEVVEGSGQVAPGQATQPARAVPVSSTTWSYGSRSFQIGVFQAGDRSGCTYSLSEDDPGTTDPNFIEAEISGLAPTGRRSASTSVDLRTRTVDGTWSVPWPVFCWFLEFVAAVGDDPPGTEAIKRTFDEHFASYRLSLPGECLNSVSGGFQQNGWDVHYTFGVEDGIEFLECFATHRMTNDRLYRIYVDGRVDLIDSSTDGMVREHDRQFYAEVRRRGHA